MVQQTERIILLLPSKQSAFARNPTHAYTFKNTYVFLFKENIYTIYTVYVEMCLNSAVKST